MTAGHDARAAALSELAVALVDALDERSLDRLAEMLVPRLRGAGGGAWAGGVVAGCPGCRGAVGVLEAPDLWACP